MFMYEDIGFRPIDRNDLELIRRMHNDTSTLLNLGDVTLISSTQQEVWWENSSTSRMNTQFCICHNDYDQVIGVWRLQNLEQNNRSCEIGLDIFPLFRRKGFGTKAYKMILSYLFEHYNIHMVYIRVASFNKDALSLYRKIGFKETGRVVESIYRHGKYWDNVLMCMTQNDYHLQFTRQ